MASTGLMLSVVSILVRLEEFDGLVGVNDNLAALLHDGWLEEAVLVALCRQVGAVEERLDALQAIHVTAGASGYGLDRFGFGLDSELPEEFSEVADREGGNGCCVFDNHFSDD